ncbi:MAG: GatB/YqeY domain-containing protein [Planctomycetes bacterium]|nr:GatB/YqeY domain-containing protein [Planctomycetota bacterium]MCB9905095.1 GatB/YqeY domain-containing protein [Planctomycetota bacterium]
MSIQERMNADVKQAMRDGDDLVKGTLRMVIAEIKNKRIELQKDLTEADVEAVLMRCVKSRQDSEQQYRDANRPELAEKEAAEIAVIQKYLPEQLNEDEARSVVQRIIAEVGATSKKDMGAVMKALMASYKGKIDGRLVQRLVGELLP